MRHVAAAVLAFGLLTWFVPPPALDAQQQTQRPVPDLVEPSVVDVSILVGVLTPLGDLTSDPQSFGTAMSTSAALGGALTWWLQPRWGFEVEATYAPADLRLKPSEFPGVVPDELGDARWFTGTVNLVYRLPQRGSAAVAEPYASVGAGVRHLSVDRIAAPEVEDATDPMVAVAAGLTVRMASRVSLRAELRNRISSYESPRTGDSRLQNDLGIAVGVRARLR